MLEGREMEKECPTERLRGAIIGAEKNGKSVLLSTAPGNKLYLDTDQRAEAVSGKPGVYAITLKDPQYPKMPEVAEEIVDIMSGLEKSLDLSKLCDKRGNRIFPNVPVETMVDNLIFDSMSTLAKCQVDYEMYNNPDLARKIKIGPNVQISIPSGWDAWNAEKESVQQLIMRAFSLDCNIWCTFHETPEKAPDSTGKDPKYTGRISIYPVNLKSLLKYFNEVWRVKLTAVANTTGVRYLPRVYPLPDFSMDAATTMMLDAVEEPNITAMIAKHKVRSGQTKTLPEASQEVPVAPKKIAGIN